MALKVPENLMVIILDKYHLLVQEGVEVSSTVIQAAYCALQASAFALRGVPYVGAEAVPRRSSQRPDLRCPCHEAHCHSSASRMDLQ